MKLIISLVVVALLIIGGFAFYNFYFNSYKPIGPTYQNPNENQTGVPVKQQDQAADAMRTRTIQALDTALKSYYAKHEKSPDTLDQLVEENLMRSIPVDPVTNDLPQYFPDDAENGCKVESTLSDGSVIAGYCK